jgi:hypothetical protein
MIKNRRIKKLSNLDKQQMKYRTTAQLIQNTINLYITSNDYEKKFIGTIIGATIFYLPSGKKLWT